MNNKWILLLIYIFALFENGYCQKEDYLTDTPFLIQLEVYNNYLAFSYTEDSTSYIAFSDLEAKEATYFTFKELNKQISRFTIKDDFLFFSSFDIGEVSRLDLTNPEKDPVIILDGLQNPRQIDISDSSVFLSVKTNDLAHNDVFYNRLLKFDLDSLDQDPIILVDSVVISALSDYGSEVIYSTNYPYRCVYLYNGENRLIGCPPGPINDFEIRGNEVYSTSAKKTYESPGAIVKFDALNESGDFTVLNDNVRFPNWLAIYENYIYVFEFFDRKISRIKLEEVSDVSIVANPNVVEGYPNPTSDIFNIKGKENLLYNIYSINGIKMIDGNLSGDGRIDVKSLPSGFYILYLEDGSISKFQKI